MYLLICKREAINGDIVFVPIMKVDDDGDETGSMATWETREEVLEFCRTHILAKASQNIIIDEEVGEIDFR